MDIIAIRNVKESSIRRFLAKWWPITGVMKVDQHWISLSVTGTEYWGTIGQYSQIVSDELEKTVVYVGGESGVVQRFSLYEKGIQCPVSKSEARRFGLTRTNEYWYLENRLSGWGIGEEDQKKIRECLARFDQESVDGHLHSGRRELALTELVTAFSDAWGLSRMWTSDTIDEIANGKDLKVI